MRINILEYLELKTLANYPDRIAVIDGGRSTKFSELVNLSKIAAQLIINHTNCINKPIAVYLPKSTETIIANLATIYSGNFYTNLDVKTPVNRIKGILDTVEPVLVITNSRYKDSILSSGIDMNILLLIDSIENENVPDNAYLLKRLDRLIDTDPLCIINTSGSTGTPKGVVLNHRSFIDFTEWAIETLKIGNNEIVGSLSPVVFDIYSFELCMLIAKGSTIVLIPENFAAFPISILELINKFAVTFIFWVPTIMVNIANLDLLSKIRLGALKTIWFAGEVFPTKQFNYWKRHLSEAKFVNLYGPIEITLDCTYYIVDRELADDEPIPIGFPCKNTDVLILNSEDKISEINEYGELCVRGTSLAMGYYNNWGKTTNAFVQNPLNKNYPEIIYRTGDQVYKNDKNEIIFVGRNDTLIKHLGYRIELTEIEHVIINTLNLAKNACVIYNFKSKEIVLFYESKEELSVSDFRKAASTVLPNYMIPRIYNRMDQLPRNLNGKIDRLFLHRIVNENGKG